MQQADRQMVGEWVGVRWPWRRRDGWNPKEAAVELQRRYRQLGRELARRPGARGVPALAREEILADAIAAVSVEGQRILNESHLLGAFWRAVDFRLRRYHEGRHLTRLGSRRRVELPTDHATSQPGVQERLERLERTRTATDHLADLDPLERRVIVMMASQSIGPLAVSRQLNLPLGEVRSAARSGRLKLDRVAVIQEAGRMCHHRKRAITATVRGTATPEQARQARAHLAACTTCKALYRRLQHQTEQGHRRHAITAVLPASAVGLLHRLAGWTTRRPTLPAGTGERATQLVAGGGLAKAAAATTAVIAATATLTSGLHTHHWLRHRPAAPAHVATATPEPPSTAATSEAPPPAASTPPPPTSPPPSQPPQGEAPAAEREFTPAGEAPPSHAKASTPRRAGADGGEPPAQTATVAEGGNAAKEFGAPGG
jgi:DNA-directed RNA polymerase specialized sigma24 family protein